MKSSVYAEPSCPPLATYLAFSDCISIVELLSLVGDVLGEVCVDIQKRIHLVVLTRSLK